MADDNTPDLNSVLKSLASFTAPKNPSLSGNTPSSLRRAVSNPRPQPRPSDLISKPPGGPTIDPTTITTWPAALRYVMRTIGSNEEIQLRLKGISRSHAAQEKQWWEKRTALLKTQQARAERKQELDQVLRSIGAQVDSKATSTTKEDEAEIKRFDLQVHSACVDLEKAFEAEMRGFNIPFFVLKSNLIQDEPSTEIKSVEGVPSKLSKSELVNLKRRMLVLLNDLCKDE
ncbi:hypothetical protein N7495_002851 [Penicillium taxi]|uniref:uncharacterized protein n=1 Tax=Penicillium taxi TaxID=168475 RepID=UPI002544E8A5|nr:uncharacterized protein N7495_002851 [Penicillium taxi]KAJ5902323.1 hypothetical protein N7495_002851 [Penicillium taxi]